ncbi:ribosome assembly RNA-binding protein YhbY [Clostridium sp.]|jgi:RNA-binding protein|uniref:ribosome assembly RNA-binding protein YhbY n=1 Tax=Clostridium sp. TaxID=1506 RepID=UPI00258F7ED1|nr:ribosome assembly RNA-binding protein YhbY [Clostridium sp.]MDF2504395.1 RNA-binding protein YhbY family [Clostridium sp.]
MISSKQRSYLRGLANTIQPIFQVGKNDMEETFVKQVDDALKARELIKITVLETSDYSAREASDLLCKKLKCEGVQAIGRKFVLYRRSKDKAKIELP